MDRACIQEINLRTLDSLWLVKMLRLAGYWWLTPVVLANWKAESRRITV
jgi:hypothetical protein